MAWYKLDQTHLSPSLAGVLGASLDHQGAVCNCPWTTGAREKESCWFTECAKPGTGSRF